MQQFISKKNVTNNNVGDTNFHCLNNDANCEIKFLNSYIKSLNTQKINFNVNNVKIECNDSNIPQPKHLYLYDLLILCKDIHQIQLVKNNVLKSSKILNEDISKLTKSFDNGDSCHEIFSNLKKKEKTTNIISNSSHTSKSIANSPQLYFTYHILLECYEPLQIELIDYALLKKTIVVHSKIQLKNKLIANALVSKESNEHNNDLDDVIFHVYETEKNENLIEEKYINKSKFFPNLSNKSINHSNIIEQEKINSTMILRNSSKILFNNDDPCNEINSKSNEIKSCIDNNKSNMVVNFKSSNFKRDYELIDRKSNTITMKDLDHFSTLVNILDAKRESRHKKKINVEKLTSNINPLVNIDNRDLKLYDDETNNDNNYNKDKNKNTIDTKVSLIFKDNVLDPCQVMKNTKVKNSMEICNDGLRKYSQQTLRNENESLFTKYPISQSHSKLLNKNLTNDNNPNQTEIFTPQILNSIIDSTSMKDKKIVQGSIDHFKDNFNFNQSEDYESLFAIKEYYNARNCAHSTSNLIVNETPNTNTTPHWTYEKDNTTQNLSTLEEQFSLISDRQPKVSLNLSPKCQGYINNESNCSQQIDSILSISSDVSLQEWININNFSFKAPILENSFKNDVCKIINDSTSNRNVQYADELVGSLEEQNLIEIVVQQPSIEHIDKMCEALTNKNLVLLKNNNFLYNDFLNNSHLTSKNNFNTFDQVENRKYDLQTHVFDKNVKDDINNFSPNLLEIIVECPRNEEVCKTKSCIQNHEIQNYANKLSNKHKRESKIVKYTKKRKVGKKIQTNLTSPPKDERIFSKLDGYICLEDDEILL